MKVTYLMSGSNSAASITAKGFSVSTTLTDYTFWFTGAVTLTNETGASLANWSVGFDVLSPITSLWGGTIVSQSGSDYVVTSAGWNAAVPPGGSVTFYFNGNGPAPAVPGGFVVNGTTLDSSVVTPPVVTPPVVTPPVVAPPVVTPPVVTTPTVTQAGTLAAAMVATQNWGTGWNGLVTITDGGASVTGWTVSFTLAGMITNLWDGSIVSHVGTTYTVGNAAWDATLAAGHPVTFGFNAAGAEPALPTSFVINGGSISAPAPVVLPTLSVSGGSVTETPSGVSEVFTVTLSAPATTAVSFSFATQDGTALAGTDYVAQSGTATIAAGQASATISVATRPGRTGTEQFSLLLSSPVGATLSQASATGTIINAPSLSVAGTTVTEASTGTTSAVFAINLSGPDTVPVTVTYSTVAGTAVAGTDFVASAGSVTIAAGSTSAIVSVPTMAGSAGSHSFTLVLSNPSGAAIASGTATAVLVTPAAAPAGGGTPPVLQLANITADVTPPSAGGIGSLLPGGYLHTSGNQIVDATGHDVRLAAVNWFGMDNPNFGPGGLDQQSYKAIMDRMAEAGFNTIRLPISNAFLTGNFAPLGVNYALNPDLKGLSGLALLDKIVTYAGQIGLKIILDDHDSSGTSGPNSNGLWYDSIYSAARFQSDWVMLAQHYAGNSTVIGADLFNEPHSVFANGALTGATWGDGSATDWAKAATSAGDAIQAVNPNWLIIVEGIQAYQGTYTNWGANLVGVAAHPVVLTDPNHLVYSVHTYPASVDPEPWDSAPNYPANLPAVWTQQFGYIAQQGIAPVFIGEYGSNLTSTADSQWLQALVNYTNTQGGASLPSGQQGMSTAYFAWNSTPGSYLSGLTQPDYATANTQQQQEAQNFAYHGPSQTGTLDFSVGLAAPSSTPVTINYTTRDGTAQAGRDYVATSGSLTFAPGTTAAIVPALLLNPGTSGNLTFMLDLSSSTGQSLGVETATIVHDPSATASDSSQQWSNTAYHTVTLTNTSSQTINGWEVAVQTAGRVQTNQVYDGQLIGQSGSVALFSSASWNQTIAPGASAHFEFGLTQNAINTPVLVSVVHTGTW